MGNELTIYECADLIRQIEERAEAAGGEISDDDLQALVVAQTTSLTKLGNLCGFMKYVEHRIDECKTEEQRIAALRKQAERRLEGIKRFLVPFVSQYRAEKGRPMDVGTFTLSTRKSESVVLDDFYFNTDENRKEFCTEKIAYQPDKAKIKEAIKGGRMVEGAIVVVNESLQVK